MLSVYEGVGVARRRSPIKWAGAKRTSDTPHEVEFAAAAATVSSGSSGTLGTLTAAAASMEPEAVDAAAVTGTELESERYRLPGGTKDRVAVPYARRGRSVLAVDIARWLAPNEPDDDDTDDAAGANAGARSCARDREWRLLDAHAGREMSRGTRDPMPAMAGGVGGVWCV
jgi:hypothetical protein